MPDHHKERILLDSNQLTGQIPHYWMNLAQVEAIILVSHIIDLLFAAYQPSPLSNGF